ncbi:MAG: D-Ala-D-Ala carboxypeptidase family metallohydrolase [Alphaproteobacteria bacterium]|nr:D-Ala-D-Ala carboxypeptidase family metallohydrolase [Alphaproteobacteria bacterium]
MKYFSMNEFTCNCCDELPESGMNPVLLEKLDRLRELCGFPILVSSGYRCPIHNQEVGGVKNSQHVQGCAADIYCYYLSVDDLADLAAEVGFDGIGRYYDREFVHVDCRSNGLEPNCYQWTE